MERPSRCGEKRTTVWPSPYEERGSEGAVAPPMCDHRVVLHHCVVREWCHPSGSAVATCLNATARTLWAARAVQGDVVSVWQILDRTPSAPPIPAQRVARCDDHCTRNCLLKNKLRQRYSRSIVPPGKSRRRAMSQALPRLAARSCAFGRAHCWRRDAGIASGRRPPASPRSLLWTAEDPHACDRCTFAASSLRGR
jgi:hypothetical protein